jgi:hypothetical protein
MDNDRTQVPLQLWYQFKCDNFSVVPALMGQSHEFEIDGKRAKITLPNVNDLRDDDEDNSKVVCQSWFLIDEKQVPAAYVIRRIDVRIELSEVPNIHPDMLVLPVNQRELITEAEQETLNNLCNIYFDFAVTAYEYWLATLRWKTGVYMIGRTITADNASGWSPRLRTIKSDKEVWANSISINIEWKHETTEAEWIAAKESLQRGEEVPAHIVLLQASQEYHKRRDYRRSLIDIAIACEVYLRFRVLASLPAHTLQPVLSAVEAMNISQYVTKFFPELLSEQGKVEYKPINKELTSLFDARNKIMHMNNNERSNSAQCLRFIELAQRLFQLDDGPACH